MNIPSLLLVDTDVVFLRAYKALLESHFRVFTSENFAQGLATLQQERPDCALVEYDLGESNGHHLAAWAKENHPSCSILLMGSQFGRQTILDSFSHRIFDILEKPFTFDVALQKLRSAADEARLRRQYFLAPLAMADGVAYKLDSDRRVLHHGQQIIFLTTTEVKVLDLLLKSVNKVVSRQQMVELIWGNEIKVADNTLDTHLTNLRKKAPFLKTHIRGLRGVGYVFEIKNP